MKLFKNTLFIMAGLIMTCLAFSAGATVPIDLPVLATADISALAFGGIVVNKANLSILFQAFKSAFNTGFRGGEANWQRIATRVPSSTGEEKYGWLGQWPRLREWVGDRHIKNLALFDYSIKNKSFESTVAVPKENIEDDSYGVFSPLMQEMGYAAQTHPDEMVFELLKAGFATECYDGQYFFDTDHPVGETSVSNMQAGAGDAWYLLDTNRPLKPLILQMRKDYAFTAMTATDDESVFMRKEFRYGLDARLNVGYGFWQMAFGSKATLDQTNFDLAIAAMMGFKSDEDRPLGISPNLIVCGPSNRAAAQAVIDKEFVDGGDSNTNFKAVDLLIVPWLA